MKELILTGSPAESFAHKAIKHLLSERFCKKAKGVAKLKIEKFFGNRFADVYLQLKSGEKIVVEVQNSKISVQELKQRTMDYNHLGMHVLWVIHGEGNCVAAKKYPRDAKCQKVSPAEKYLHQMYGGRVYYVNLNMQDGEAELNRPFALHFTKLLKKKKRGMFQSGYDKFFYRDVNFALIPSWNLVCTKFAGYKIARFYDKNIKYALKEQMQRFLLKSNVRILRKKRDLKFVLKHYNGKYGDYLILSTLIELITEKKLTMEQKLFKKIYRKFIN